MRCSHISIRLFTDVFYTTKSTMDDGWMTDRHVQGNYIIFKQLKELIHTNTDYIENNSFPTSLHLYRACKPTMCSLESPTKCKLPIHIIHWKLARVGNFPRKSNSTRLVAPLAKFGMYLMQCNALLPYLQRPQGQRGRLCWTRVELTHSDFMWYWWYWWYWSRVFRGHICQQLDESLPLRMTF